MTMGPLTWLVLLVSVQTVYNVQPHQVCCELGCYNNSSPYNHLDHPRCPDGTWPVFNSYTRKNRQHPVTLTHEVTPLGYDPENRVIFVMHGFRGKIKPWMIEMKDKLLDRENASVILVDWSKGAKAEKLHPRGSYRRAAATTRVVADYVARLARHLVDVGAARKSKLWCIGHSLGAHTCGEAGIKFKLGRITGLDPAGPHFENNIKLGLRPESAMFVDVIHTDHMKVFCCGHLAPRGHVDFYPNGGRRQPGCLGKRNAITKSFSCSHRRAYQYFTESISYSCPFYTGSVCTDVYDMPASCNNTRRVLQVMGYRADDRNYVKKGLFYLRTGRVNIRGASNETCEAKLGQAISTATPVTQFQFILCHTIIVLWILLPHSIL